MHGGKGADVTWHDAQVRLGNILVNNALALLVAKLRKLIYCTMTAVQNLKGNHTDARCSIRGQERCR